MEHICRNFHFSTFWELIGNNCLQFVKEECLWVQWKEKPEIVGKKVFCLSELYTATLNGGGRSFRGKSGSTACDVSRKEGSGVGMKSWEVFLGLCL